MKSFTLVLTVTMDFRDDKVNNIGFKWGAENEKALSNAPTALNSTIAELMQECTYALAILSPLFEDFSKLKEPVIASASVKFEGENEDWTLSFSVPKDTEENKYIRALLFRLLTDKTAFLREVKVLKDELY